MTLHLNKSATRLVERDLLPFLRKMVDRGGTWGGYMNEARKLLEKFTPPKPSIKKRASKKAKKDSASGHREAHRLETAAIRGEVFRRAGYRCEGATDADGEDVSSNCEGDLQLDHWLNGIGRRRQKQSVKTCWALCAYHHRRRTAGNPSVAEWNDRFQHHCQKWGYPFTPHIEKAALSNPDRVRYAEGEKDLS